jgi:WD40 repeat protein
MEAKQISASEGAEQVLRDNLPLLPRHLPQMKYDNNVVKLALSPNGSQITTVSGNPLSIGTATGPREDRTVQTRDTRTGKEITTFRLDNVNAVSINPDGRYIAVSASERGDVTDTRTAQARQATPSTFVLQILEASKSPQPIVQTNSKLQFFNLRFSPDSRFFAALSGDGSARLVDLPSRGVQSLRSSGVFSLLFSQRSQNLVTLHDDYHVRVWDLSEVNLANSNTNIRAFDTKLTNFGSLADLSFDGKYIAIIEWRNSVNVLREGSGVLVSPNPLTHDDAITAAKFTRDGNRLVTASEDGTLRVWDFTTGREKQPRIFLDGKVLAIVFSPDGNYMMTITSTNIARLWSVKDSIVEIARMNHAAQVEDAAFSLDGNYVATASLDKVVQVWEVDTSLKSDSSSEACARLTRNLTIQEYQRYIPSEPYHATCSNLP